MHHVKPRWAIRKRDGRWRIYDRGTWADTYDTLPDAHTAATQNAVAETLYAPGGLTLLAEMRYAHDNTNTLFSGRWWNRL